LTAEEHIALVDERRRQDVRRLHELIRAEAPELPVEASEASLGYGPFRYRYASGREGDSHLITLTSRKAYLAMYVNSVQGDAYVPELFAPRLAGASVGRSCVRIKRVDDVDLDVVRELVRAAVARGGASAV
jgi:hypothetical protein